MEMNFPPSPEPNRQIPDDGKLVKNAVEGHDAAFALLFERYYPALYQFLSRKVQSKSDADDLAMESFSKAFLKLHTFVPRHSFGTWLYRIALNQCIDHQRRMLSSKRAMHWVDLQQLGDWADEHPNPEEALIQEENRLLTVALLHRLPPTYRRMLELRYLEEMSYLEIADQLLIPLGTVKAQLHRARELARDLLSRRSGA